MYFGRNETPKEDTIVICRCPNWNDIGYQIAKFENDKFCYDDQPNERFDENVIAWTPLNEDGEQIETIHKFKADQWDKLDDQISKCYSDIVELAIAFGYL